MPLAGQRHDTLASDSCAPDFLAAGTVEAWTRLNLSRDIFPAAGCVLLICFLSTTNTPQLAAWIFYFSIEAGFDIGLRASLRQHRKVLEDLSHYARITSKYPILGKRADFTNIVREDKLRSLHGNS